MFAMNDYETKAEEIRQNLQGMDGIRHMLCSLEHDAFAEWVLWFSGQSPVDVGPNRGTDRSAEAVGPFQWVDACGLAKEFLEAWTRLFAAAILHCSAGDKQSTCHTYWMGVFGEAQESLRSLNGRSFSEVLKVPCLVYAKLYGARWDEWAMQDKQLLSEIRDLLCAHAAVCTEYACRQKWWTSDHGMLDEFLRTLNPESILVPSSTWKTLFPEQHNELVRQIHPNVRPADVYVPKINCVPARREYWGPLQKRYQQSLRDTQAIQWEGKLLNLVVQETEEELPSFSARKEQTCVLPLEEYDECRCRCQKVFEDAGTLIDAGTELIERSSDAGLDVVEMITLSRHERTLL